MPLNSDIATANPGKAAIRPQKSIGQKWNFIIVGLLVFVVLAAFFWQVQKTKRDFLHQATEHSRMIAGMVSFSLNNAKQSQAALEKTILSSLASSAKFTDYLDTVEPFSADELTSFALESGLAGIKILHRHEAEVEGPPGWSPKLSCESASTSLLHYPEKNLYLLVWPASEPGCIMVGFNSKDTDRLMHQIGAEQLMADMTHLPLIEYIRLENAGAAAQLPTTRPSTRLIRDNGRHIAESQIRFDAATTLIVGVDASRYARRIRQLFAEFVLFSLLLITLGAFFSWLISRHQASFLRQTRMLEREMARQHEEAALGRAAATISHEIKNPLNAISMGLQRLQMELPLPEEHGKLITSMRQAVHRTNNIISDLKQYTQPIALHYTEISPGQLIEEVVNLYRQKCEALGIAVTLRCAFTTTLHADEALLGQVLENLLKNAMEAQPAGGRIDIATRTSGDRFLLRIENPGFSLAASEVHKIMEPYFTSKTQGTGLGLAVSRRIIESHGGSMGFVVSAPGVLQVTVEMPIVAQA